MHAGSQTAAVHLCELRESARTVRKRIGFECTAEGADASGSESRISGGRALEVKIVLEISSFDEARSAIALLVKYLSLERPASLTPISELGLTVRAEDTLRSVEIFTVEALLERTESELLRTPNVGRKVLNEIKQTLLDRQQRLAI